MKEKMKEKSSNNWKKLEVIKAYSRQMFLRFNECNDGKYNTIKSKKISYTATYLLQIIQSRILD